MIMYVFLLSLVILWKQQILIVDISDFELFWNHWMRIRGRITRCKFDLIPFLKDELLGLAGDPNSDPVFKNHGLNMDVLYRTGETQEVKYICRH